MSWQIKKFNFVFAQPINWDNFSYEDDSEFHKDENDSRN